MLKWKPEDAAPGQYAEITDADDQALVLAEVGKLCDKNTQLLLCYEGKELRVSLVQQLGDCVALTLVEKPW